ncbi:MAG: hypothetical protein Q4E53_05355 [Eubacteriales bacterium]|nr:hypothetical protein [Eubacteriales bacterium]
MIHNPRIVSALIGLAGAVQTNPKSENTDHIVKMALLSEDSDSVIEEIHKEKYSISPNCATCPNPCGNTSDYDMGQLEETTEDIVQLKFEIFDQLIKLVSNLSEEKEFPQIIYRAISFLGYDLEEKPYRMLLEQMKAYTLE